ncbi:GNAT family N-acetyltransferase [Nocardiopsis sp. N85]|uniref:GNAT family N-acetyltransferase n=1 Tax=Nocardiopsis sp. N85 TaxID=3029400 RepID=UPI00237EF0E3|nr:GNAT family N-acetyltransferase [Nocardiopsis sp. N85]MDE3722871.1 GNAT family N-acetyltransferase [Nocardiopsis sp. N85]
MAVERHPSTSRTGDPGWEVRTATEAEIPDASRVFTTAINIPMEELLGVERDHPVDDPDRILVALDGDRVVGTANSHRFALSVPGGPRPAAGVTGVGVWPTHRRRGVLTAIMRHQLADVRARGENLAILWASEGGIYGRHGYGRAAHQHTVAVRRAHAALRPDAPRDPGLTVELAAPADVLPELDRLHRAALTRRPGGFPREGHWWGVRLWMLSRPRPDTSDLRVALVRGPDGALLGSALHRVTTQDGEDGLPAGKVTVHEPIALTPAARTALYEYLFATDLTVETVVVGLPDDDPLPALLADPAQAVRRTTGALWLRLVDVPAALAERSYAHPVDTVIEVADRHAPWNAGRWHLKTDGADTRVEATDTAPDLTVDVSHLGAAHLGRGPLTTRVDAGTAVEHTPGAAARLDTALYTPRAPLCDTGF